MTGYRYAQLALLATLLVGFVVALAGGGRSDPPVRVVLAELPELQSRLPASAALVAEYAVARAAGQDGSVVVVVMAGTNAVDPVVRRSVDRAAERTGKVVLVVPGPLDAGRFAAGLPPAVRLVDADGGILRPARETSGYSTGFVLLWGLLLLVGGATVGALPALFGPGPARTFGPSPPPASVPPPAVAPARPERPVAREPARFDFRQFVGEHGPRYERQCPRCGSFAVAGSVRYRCGRCGADWSLAPGEPWPDVVIDPRRSHRALI